MKRKPLHYNGSTLKQHYTAKCKCRLMPFQGRMRKACAVPGTAEAGGLAMLSEDEARAAAGTA